jgi:hypothetical protein
MLTALALIHHLVLTEGIPFIKVAQFFSELLTDEGVLLLEFVPLEDSQVHRLIAARADSFEHYSLESLRVAFSHYFYEVNAVAIEDSYRSLLLLKKR